MTTAKAGRYNETLFTPAGALHPNASVEVRLPGSAVKASLYTDENKTAGAANPTTSDAVGNLTFWADHDTTYDLLVAGVTIPAVAVTPTLAALSGTFVRVNEGPLYWGDTRIGGIMDDAVSDQSAKWTAAKALLATDGGELRFPPGAIRLASPMTANFHGLRIAGSGKGGDWIGTAVDRAGTTIVFDVGAAADGLVLTNGTPQGYVGGFGLQDIALVAKTQGTTVRDILSLQLAAHADIKNVNIDGAGRYGTNLDTVLGVKFANAKLNWAGTSTVLLGSTLASISTSTSFDGCHFREAQNGPGTDIDCLGAHFIGECVWESNGPPAGTPAAAHGLLIRKGVVVLDAPYFENNAAFDIKAGTVGTTNLTINGFTSENGSYTLAGPNGGHVWLDQFVRDASFLGGKYSTRNVPLRVHPSVSYVCGTGMDMFPNAPTVSDATAWKSYWSVEGFFASGNYGNFGALGSKVGLGVWDASPPAAKPAVTGSRGSNAALASLLTALASYGLITDSSTA